jgi:hypothetical protein
MAFTNYILKHPGRWLAGYAVMFVIISSLSFGLGFFIIDPINERDFLVWGDDAVTAMDLQKLSIEYINE